ncbi:MAG: transporter substrate-binding protein [Hyphomicrobiales bacterium]|nr:transporter substrate-binding protein [Hyphomicrobiales bacterium]
MAVGLLLLGGLAPVAAQELPVPSFWDPQYRAERPDTGAIRLIRFVTEDDYPPFNFALPDGSLTGFNVELARAVCEELKIACTIQPRRWDTLIPAITENRADAAIASLAMNAANRAQLDFTAPYYRTPARFVSRRNGPDAAPALLSPETLAGWAVAVEARTAHEAFLRAFFPQADIRAFASRTEAQEALKSGDVKLIFGDGVSLSLWLNGTDAANCCVFAGGPYTESRFFGDGVGIAVRKGNGDLRRALDWGLRRVYERGLYAELYLKFFPIGFF